MDKLYVLVRKDLDKNQQAVQAGHALAEYLMRVHNHNWTNGTLIYLGVDNEKDLNTWGEILDIHDIKWAKFIEPDRNNEMTAISAVSSKNIFKKLNLLNL